MRDPTEKPQGQPLPTPIEPRVPPATTAMQQCLHCKQVLTEAEARAHKKGTDHEIVPYP